MDQRHAENQHQDLDHGEVDPAENDAVDRDAQVDGAEAAEEGGGLAGALPPDGMLITLELDETRAREARENFGRAGLADRTSVIVGDGKVYTSRTEAEGALRTVKVCESGGTVGGPAVAPAVPAPR